MRPRGHRRATGSGCRSCKALGRIHDVIESCPKTPDPGVCGENCVEGVLTVRQAVAALGRGLEKGMNYCQFQDKLAFLLLNASVKFFAVQGSQAVEFSP